MSFKNHHGYNEPERRESPDTRVIYGTVVRVVKGRINLRHKFDKDTLEVLIEARLFNTYDSDGESYMSKQQVVQNVMPLLEIVVLDYNFSNNYSPGYEKSLLDELVADFWKCAIRGFSLYNINKKEMEEMSDEEFFSCFKCYVLVWERLSFDLI